ncbi:MAG: hypothetical protein AAFQ01_02950 [Bacteroidota bacterium]
MIPTTPDIDSLIAATKTANTVVKFGGHYRILLTDCPTGSSKVGQEAQEGLREEGFFVIDQRIRRGGGVQHASLPGTTVAQQPTKYQGPWWDYRQAFTDIYEILDNLSTT